ncbi:MAG: hypothetical protein ACI92B_002774, partial [Marinobacter maritimus]
GSNGESTVKTPSLPELLESLLAIIGRQPPLTQHGYPCQILRLHDLTTERNLLLLQLHGTINWIDGWAKVSRPAGHRPISRSFKERKFGPSTFQPCTGNQAIPHPRGNQ